MNRFKKVLAVLVLLVLVSSQVALACDYEPKEVPGCTDPTNGNYNQEATIDDGSCYVFPPPENAGHGDGLGGSQYSPASCDGIYSSPAKLQGYHRDNSTTVTWNWWAGDKSDHQSILYGYSPDKLVYGVNGLSGDTTSFTTGGLEANRVVYAQIWTWHGQCVTVSNSLDP